MMENIECRSFKPFSSGTLKGFVDFYVPKWGVHIHGCSYHVKENRKWINFPSKEYTNDQGEKKYLPYLHFEKPEHKTAFISQAIDALENYLKNENL